MQRASCGGLYSYRLHRADFLLEPYSSGAQSEMSKGQEQDTHCCNTNAEVLLHLLSLNSVLGLLYR